VNEPREKKRGLFGRLFGGRPAEEPAAPPKPEPHEEPSVPSGEAVTAEAPPIVEVLTPVETVAPAALTPPEPPTTAAPAEAPKQTWFQRLRSGLAKTSSKLSDGITSLFTKRKLDGATLEDLEDLLIQADLGVETATAITSAIAKGRFEKGITADEVKAILAAEVEKVLAPVARPLDVRSGRKPHVVLVVGVNGTGKTTTIGKLSERFRREGLSVMLAAGDTFRAAAIDQLKIWGQRTGVPVLAREVGADASGLAFDAVKAAKDQQIDVLMIDTAGRLQNKQALMDELEKVIRVIRKQDPTAPHDCLLVLDATTGQNALSQVEVFREKAGVTGLVMTKLDGTARGGILVAIAARHRIPIHAIGVGEGVDDLQPFDPREFSKAIAAS
jgi:fused signal recognition particle receptor